MNGYLLKDKKIESDRELEKNLLEFQKAFSVFELVLRDYLNLGIDDANHPVIKKRTKNQFFKEINRQFGNLEECISLMFQKQKKKKINPDGYIIEHIIDTTEWSDDYFYLNLYIIVKS